MRVTLVALLIWSAAAPALADPDYLGLKALLKTLLGKERVEQLGEDPTVDQLIDALQPSDAEKGAAKELEEHAERSDENEAKMVQKALARLEAPEALLNVSRRLPQNDPDALVGQAHAYVLSGDYAAAQLAAKQALELDPNNRKALDLEWFTRSRARTAPEGKAELASVAPGAAGFSEAASRAGARASARLQAVGFAKQAMSRLNVGDAEEGLRLARLAEAADPSLPDSYMQQGLAYLDKKDPAAAAERFRTAGVLWRLAGRPKDLRNAALADKAHGQALAESKSAPANAPARGGDSKVPLGLIAGLGALAVAGAGAFFALGDRAKRFVYDHPYVSIGAAVAGAGVAAWLALGAIGAGGGAALATAGGPSLSAAAASGGVAVQPAVGGAALGSVAAGAVSLATSDNTDRTSMERQAPQQSRPHSSVHRPSAKDEKLRTIINELFRPQDKLPGGTAGALRNESLTGQATQGRFHLEKAKGYIRALETLLQQNRLDATDRATAEAVLADLRNSVEAASRSAR